MLAGFKNEAGRQVNRHSARACGGVGRSACVQGERIKAGVGVAGHGFS